MMLWDERIRAGIQAAQDWRDLPLPLLIDKIFKAAGFRDVIKENGDLRIEIDRLRAELEDLRTIPDQ